MTQTDNITKQAVDQWYQKRRQEYEDWESQKTDLFNHLPVDMEKLTPIVEALNKVGVQLQEGPPKAIIEYHSYKVVRVGEVTLYQDLQSPVTTGTPKVVPEVIIEVAPEVAPVEVTPIQVAPVVSPLVLPVDETHIRDTFLEILRNAPWGLTWEDIPEGDNPKRQRSSERLKGLKTHLDDDSNTELHLKVLGDLLLEDRVEYHSSRGYYLPVYSYTNAEKPHEVTAQLKPLMTPYQLDRIFEKGDSKMVRAFLAIELINKNLDGHYTYKKSLWEVIDYFLCPAQQGLYYKTKMDMKDDSRRVITILKNMREHWHKENTYHYRFLEKPIGKGWYKLTVTGVRHLLHNIRKSLPEAYARLMELRGDEIMAYTTDAKIRIPSL